MSIHNGLLTMVSEFPQCLGGRPADIPITIFEQVSNPGNQGFLCVMEDSCGLLVRCMAMHNGLLTMASKFP
jgi:hypothetical protein